MWDERVHIYGTPEVPNNFPYNCEGGLVDASYCKKKKKCLALSLFSGKRTITELTMRESIIYLYSS